MDKYMENKPCSKCGSHNVLTRHMQSQAMNGIKQTEWLRRKCNNCEYMWDESTLDTKEAVENAAKGECDG
jgi:hypothetical protein